MATQYPKQAANALRLCMSFKSSTSSTVTDADVRSVEIADAESIALIRYSGDSAEVTIRSRWQAQDGRPVIVSAEPAA